MLEEEKNSLTKNENGKFELMSLPEISLSERKYVMHVHHKFYILNKLPWKYENEDLITLCNWCHSGLHIKEAVTVFLEDGKTIARFEHCDRCNGVGWFNEYSHIEGGRCFACKGSGYNQPIVKLRFG